MKYEYDKNQLFDIEHSQPMGSDHQELHITGHYLNETVMVIDGDSADIRVKLKDESNPRGFVVRKLVPERDFTLSRDAAGNRTITFTGAGEDDANYAIHLNRDNISVDMQNYPLPKVQAEQEPVYVDHKLVFHGNGSYEMHSGSEPHGPMTSQSFVRADGHYVQFNQEGLVQRGGGSDFSYFPTAEGGVSFRDYKDNHDASHQRRSHLGFERTSPFNAAIVDNDTGQYYAAERDQSQRNFMANHNGQWGRVEIIDNWGGDLARFYPHASGKEGSAQSLDFKQALIYEQQAIAALAAALVNAGVTIPSDASTDGLPQELISQMQRSQRTR